ncbi:MIP family channel protein [Jaminaea rosea]|uniref:MIP family channel protein n=1 Tax=Jaminaea rosea TaxID=1569628 RepID=A0A316UIX4_9BASI|nr:MIP family channel protein [Jaminaea rosea]PWN25170.1 MIP family channel protein [Jaminaea rosea]
MSPTSAAQRRSSNTDPAGAPAVPVSDSLPTSQHNPRWALYDGRPNAWTRFRARNKDLLAEFLGTAFILIFGAGVECQVNLHYNLFSHPQSAGDFNSQRLSWAIGVALGVWISGGVSGAHLNPTVTLSLWAFRGFPLRKVLPYITAQILGAAAGAGLVYSNYFGSIALKEGGAQRTVEGVRSTAGLFVTSPQPWLGNGQAAWSEALASGVLVCAVLALSDKGNLSVPKGCMPFAMFLTLVGIGASLGLNTGYALNFARDFGPRIFLFLVGYGSKIFTTHSYWAFWGPGLASIGGGLLGGLVYDVCVYTGEDSFVNRVEGGRRKNQIRRDLGESEEQALLEEEA